MNKIKLVIVDQDITYIQSVMNFIRSSNFSDTFAIQSFTEADNFRNFLQLKPEVNMVLISSALFHDEWRSLDCMVILNEEGTQLPEEISSVMKYQPLANLFEQLLSFYKQNKEALFDPISKTKGNPQTQLLKGGQETVLPSIYGLTYSVIQQGGKYLIVHKGTSIKREDLESLSLKMIGMNEIPSILPIDIEEIDFHISIHYRVDGKQTLLEVLSNKNISMEEYFRLLLNIVSVISESSNHMLNEERYLLDEHFIYIGNTLDDLALVYLPLRELEGKLHTRLELGRLASHLIKYAAELKGDGYQRIMNHIELPDFTIQSFKNLLIELVSTPISSRPNQSLHESLPSEGANEKKINKTKKDTQRAQRKSRKGIFTIIGSMLILLSWSIYVVYQSDPMLYGAAGVTLLGLLIIFLGGRIGMQKTPIKIEMREDLPDENRPKNPPKPHVIPQPASPSKRSDTTLLSEAHILKTNSTHLVDEEPKKQVKAALVFTSGKTVVVDGERFVIGRNPGMVNYVVNTTGVSRAHLEIVKQSNGSYGVKDLGSKNGTSINGVRIDANKIYSLKETDTVKFAKEEFSLKMGD